MTDAATQPILSSAVVGRADLARLLREAEQLDDALTTQAIHAKVGSESPAPPAASAVLDEFLKTNQLALGDEQQRAALLAQLRDLKQKAPVIHLTFASMVDGETLAELVTWLRQSLSPRVLVEVGVQPALVGGVYVRTPNHVYDLSLRAALSGKRDLLVKELEASRGGK